MTCPGIFSKVQGMIKNFKKKLSRHLVSSGLLQWKYSSKIGPIYLVASKDGLRGLFLDQQPVKFARSLNESFILIQTVEELAEYFEGTRKLFTITLDIQGTAFQKLVWNQLRKIPYGKTCSYKEIASRINRTKAFRAVGNANGKNPLCIVIPCHRVIASDGSLGGYSGGLAMKIKLLNLESNASAK